jgi:hypothetical protein
MPQAKTELCLGEKDLDSGAKLAMFVESHLNGPHLALAMLIY